MCATVLAKEIDISLFLSLLDPVWLVASRGGERERSSDDAQYSRRRRFFFFSGLSIIPPPPLAQDAQISPTHTQPKWRRLFFPRLCNFYLFLFSKIINKKRRFISFYFFLLGGSFSENGSDPSTLFLPSLGTFDNWELILVLGAFVSFIHTTR